MGNHVSTCVFECSSLGYEMSGVNSWIYCSRMFATSHVQNAPSSDQFPKAPFTPRKLSLVQAELWVFVLTELTLMVYVVKDLIFVSCSWMNGWGSRFRLVVWWIGLIGSPCSCNQVAQSIAIVCHTQKRMLTAGHTLFWCIICIHWSIII